VKKGILLSVVLVAAVLISLAAAAAPAAPPTPAPAEVPALASPALASPALASPAMSCPGALSGQPEPAPAFAPSYCGDPCSPDGASGGCIDTSGPVWKRVICTCQGGSWTC